MTRDQAGELGITEWDNQEAEPSECGRCRALGYTSDNDCTVKDLGPDIHGYRTLWIRTLTLALILLSGTAVFLTGFLLGRLT